MESTPYDPVLYRAGLEPVPDNENENAKRSKMISVRNTIRWKWVTGDDGEPVRPFLLEVQTGVSVELIYAETSE